MPCWPIISSSQCCTARPSLQVHFLCMPSGAGAVRARRARSVCDVPDTHGASAPDISTASSSLCSCSLVTRRRLQLRKREFTLEDHKYAKTETSLTVNLYV